MSEQREERSRLTWVAWSIEDLARLQGAGQISDVGDLAADIWESDEELDAFLADLRASRHASLA